MMLMCTSIIPINQKNSNNCTLKILIIDDDQRYLQTLSYSLENYQEGITVITATSAKMGLKEIKDNGFSLIIIDLLMPDMNGLEVLRCIKEMNREYLNIAIILTAHAENKLLERVKREEPAGVFDKAFFKLEKINSFIKFRD